VVYSLFRLARFTRIDGPQAELFRRAKIALLQLFATALPGKNCRSPGIFPDSKPLPARYLSGMNWLKVFLLLASTQFSIAGAETPKWVGPVIHRWNGQIGGGLWYQQGGVLRAVAPVLDEYPRPVMVGLRSDRAENGYRFDLNTFAQNAPTFNDWQDRVSQEGVLKEFGPHKAEFIWSMPTPDVYAANPYETNGAGYLWQKPEYYGAYLQYLIAPATMTGADLAALKPFYDFFTDATCATTNSESEQALRGNWANLRAKRGRVEPYHLQAVILGIEPYGDAQEALLDGARYGKIAEAYRTAIRARGGPLEKIPLGLTITEGGPISDFGRPWFKPMLDAVKKEDFSYLDLHHHYRFGSPAEELNRIYPILVNTGSPQATSPGWQNWWMPKEQWLADYSRYMFGFEDSRKALALAGENPARWKIGTSEHGMSITSKFAGNDMGAGIHWALWLAEVMRYNIDFDMNWVLVEQGYAHAQIQVREGHVTRTPAHYVYKMAQEFIGMDYCTNIYVSPTLTKGRTQEGGNYIAADITMRVFRDPAAKNYHLFVVNKSATNSAPLEGWEKWRVLKWDRLSANAFTAQNPIGNPWTPETITTVAVDHPAGKPLTIGPISVNHIELAEPDARQ
jgi:hypothetical protein